MREASFAPRVSNAILAFCTSAVILFPYLTVNLPYRRALVVQAAGILLSTLVLLFAGLMQKGWRKRLFETAPAIRLGVFLYGAAALHGAAVALIRGNDLKLVAGQLLSMGLLPLGFIAGSVLPTRKGWLTFCVSAVGAASLASLVHFVHWAVNFSSGRLVPRLYLPNNSSAVGVSLLAFLFASALCGVLSGMKRIAAFLSAAVLGLFIIGSGVRSLWAMVPLGLITVVALWRWRTAMAKRTVLWTVAPSLALVGVGAIAWLCVTAWLAKPRPNVLPTNDLTWAAAHLPPAAHLAPATSIPGVPLALQWNGDETRKDFRIGKPFPILGGRAYRIRATAHGEGGGTGYLQAVFLDRYGKWCGAAWVRLEHSDEPRRFDGIGIAPEGSTQAALVVGANPGKPSAWKLWDFYLEDMGPGHLGLLHQQLSLMRDRAVAAVFTLFNDDLSLDSSVSVRLKESRTLLGYFLQNPWFLKLTGVGLGATYSFQTFGVDDATGQLIEITQPNYVHNFFLFLLYKLGIVGFCSVLAALGIWLRALVSIKRLASDLLLNAFVTASFASLLAYSIWSLACPEILDFRVAPVWGILLAMAARPNPPSL